ncbi:Transglycosylase SLT domain-containing protein [Pseudoxanthobacter soli DSM 19599]|uniref:Transglycosylase SLT domain-containing protein n=1 Tax=Pseudoxanthobacter soli DSM 19599 TaxID=1123029 RepID=A0A1M7ZEH9_9HYPH|nr:Transglycosylase SLT domain-containing protein [Pseudoxanthobacter soli DSM 19599]
MPIQQLKAVLLASFISSLTLFATAPAASAAQNVCEREMTRASARYGVPVAILYAVGLTETGRKGSLQPNAMNIEGKSYFATSRGDAIRRFNEARRSGAKLIDLGCMQINHYFHRDQFPSLEAMLEPRTNVDYAARFLKTLKAREGSWTMAVARYHAGPNNNPAQKRYICAVITNLVATGFGSWTPRSKSFCR